MIQMYHHCHASRHCNRDGFVMPLKWPWLPSSGSLAAVLMVLPTVPGVLAVSRLHHRCFHCVVT